MVDDYRILISKFCYSHAGTFQLSFLLFFFHFVYMFQFLLSVPSFFFVPVASTAMHFETIFDVITSLVILFIQFTLWKLYHIHIYDGTHYWTEFWVLDTLCRISYKKHHLLGNIFTVLTDCERIRNTCDSLLHSKIKHRNNKVITVGRNLRRETGKEDKCETEYQKLWVVGEL